MTLATEEDTPMGNSLSEDHIRFMRSLLFGRAGAVDASDIVSDACLKVVAAQATKQPSERRITKAYLRLAVRSALADWTERRAQERGIVARQEPSIENEESFTELAQAESPLVQALVGSTSPTGEWATMSPAAWRKARSRRMSEIEGKLIAAWLVTGDYERLNRYRPAEAVCRYAASELARKGVPRSALEPAFDRRSLNRSIQTTTWIMTYLGQVRPSDAAGAWSFLAAQLSAANLYRGNLTYISEALLEADVAAGADLYRTGYLARVHEMDARVQAEPLPPSEQAPVANRCIYDVKQVRRLGQQVPLLDVQAIKQRYASGVTDIDLHRSLAFVLLRTRPDDSGGLEFVVSALRDEMDQTNAYYVTRYIMKWGLKEAPRLLNAETLASLRTVARRWPQNHYFRESASRFARKLRMG